MRPFIFIAFVAGAVLIQPARASHIIYSPGVDYGETEIEFRGHYDLDTDDRKDGAASYKFDVGHGFTNNWFSELVFKYTKPAQDSGDLEALEWENIIQLTEQRKHFADLGLLLEYVYAVEDDGHDKIEAGPLMQMLIGENLWTTNLVLQRQLGSGADSDIDWEFATRVHRPLSPRFQPGIEFYAKEDEMQLGPAFLGDFPKVAGRTTFGWQLGALLGLTNDTPDFTLRFLLEAEF